MANVKIGEYLYNALDLPFTGKVLKLLSKRKSGASALWLAEQPEIKQEFGDDEGRAQAKVRVSLRNLESRKVVQEVQSKFSSLYKISSTDLANQVISEAAKIVERYSQVADNASVNVKSASVSKSSNSKEKVMSKVKAVRLFKNPETSKIEPFGVGRPSALKIAYECNSEGNFLDAAKALAFASVSGVKSEDKMTKDELRKVIADLRGQLSDAKEEIEALRQVVANTAEGSDSFEDCEDCEDESEAVDSDEDSTSEDEGEVA